MNPLEILKESEKEFYKLFDKKVAIPLEMDYRGTQTTRSDVSLDDIKSIFTSLTIKLLEGEKARLEGLSKPEGGRFLTSDDILWNEGYNEAIDESLATVESQLSEIKQNNG